MQAKTTLYLKILLNRFNPGASESYLKALPKEEIKEIIGQNTPSNDPSLIYQWPEEEITHMHYSWLAPIVKELSSTLQPLVIASLPAEQGKSLIKFLNLPASNISLSPELKSFFLNLLWQHWKDKPSLPLQYLPTSSLEVLLSLNKSELVELVDFLALYDLAEGIRHIVDKKHLKTIYDCISPKKQQFLRICLHQQEKIASPKLEIDKWDGDAKKLEDLLHRRGLFRLGKAVSGQDSLFVQHLAHTLDSGRGSILLKYYSPQESTGITSTLAQQIHNVLNFLKKKSEP